MKPTPSPIARITAISKKNPLEKLLEELNKGFKKNTPMFNIGV
jgi:hypothetical protein